MARIAAALAGSCTACGWQDGCSCILCHDDLADMILWRCPACFRPLSTEHSTTAKPHFMGTEDGTPYPSWKYWEKGHMTQRSVQ